MPISDATRETLRDTLMSYEGAVDHMYLDTVGKVTVGVGHLIRNRDAVDEITMHTKDGDTEASIDEKQAEYDRMASLPSGQQYSFRSFEPHATLIMKDNDMMDLLDHHIDSFYRELQNIYTTGNGYPADFDDLDANVQLALFDMIFNLGATKLVNTYPSFNRHLKNGDYAAAATESGRRGIADRRNNYVADLLREAAAAGA